MKKVCLQAGHKGITTGATGAPGERDWTTKIVPMIGSILKSKGVDVYETDANGNNDPKVTSTDWDYFLAIHYDADIYNDRGGFADYPDQSVDASFARSKSLALALGEHYFKTTGIPERPQRSNANTKFYYMWSALTPSTPCVVIECGVGYRKPEDYNILRNYELVSNAIADGILDGLGIPTGNELGDLQKKYDLLLQELIEMRQSRDKWKDRVDELEKEIIKDAQSTTEHIKNLQSTVAEQNNQIVTMNETIQSLTSENKRLLDDSTALQKKIVDVTASKDTEISNLRVEVGDQRVRAEKAEKSLKELKAKLDLGLSSYSKWQRLWSLFKK
jgi:N-acetylmuramoyl-L-alanine amidase